MLRRLVVLLSAVIGALAITCYVGQQTLPNKGDVFSGGIVQSVMSVRDCGPQVRMCYKSHVRRDHDGDSSHTETRDCGDVASGRCFQDTGCTGPSHNRVCCCAGDLCNSATAKSFVTVILGALLSRVLAL